MIYLVTESICILTLLYLTISFILFVLFLDCQTQIPQNIHHGGHTILCLGWGREYPIYYTNITGTG